MTYKDITRYKTSEYEDLPECFYMDDWKVAFFYSDVIKRVVKKQLNYDTLQAYL